MNVALSTSLVKNESHELNAPKLALVSLPYGEGPQKIMPLGLQNISAYVKKNVPGFQCKIFDYSDLYFSDISQLSDLFSWQPDLVGISIYSSHAEAAITWGGVIKREIPNALLFCGGPHISLAAKEFLISSGNIFDLGICGEGEYATAKLLEAYQNIFLERYASEFAEANGSFLGGVKEVLIRSHLMEIPNAVWKSASGEIVENRKEKIQLPAEEWENPLMEYHSERLQNLYFTDRRDGKKRRAIAFTSSRGCPLTCSFCAIVAADKDGPRWRAVDASTLVGWIAEAHKAYPFEHIYMMDANFFVKKDRVLEFSEKLNSLFGGAVTWSSSSTVGYLLKLRPELPKLVKQGLRLVEMGIESGSQSQLDYMNKKVTVQNNIDAIAALQVNGIDIGLDFIMFYHDQTKKEIIENLTFLVQSGLTEHESFDHYFNIMMLYPGTPVRADLERKEGIKFDLLNLPNSREFIDNHEVREIYCAYIDDFAKPWLSSLEAAISVNIEKIANSNSSSERAYLSLLNTYLRHMPFKVLWELCRTSDRKDIISRNKEFSKYVSIIKGLVDLKETGESEKPRILEVGSSGVGGRKGELIGKAS